MGRVCSENGAGGASADSGCRAGMVRCRALGCDVAVCWVVLARSTAASGEGASLLEIDCWCTGTSAGSREASGIDACVDGGDVTDLLMLLDASVETGLVAGVGSWSLGLAVGRWHAACVVNCPAGESTSSAAATSTAWWRSDVLSGNWYVFWRSWPAPRCKSCQLCSGSSALRDTGHQEANATSCTRLVSETSAATNLRRVGIHCLMLVIARKLNADEAWQLGGHAVRDLAGESSRARPLRAQASHVYVRIYVVVVSYMITPLCVCCWSIRAPARAACSE